MISSPLCSQICWYSSWWFSSWDLCWTSHPLSKGLHHINLWKLSLGSSVCRLCSKSPLPAHYGLLPFRDFVSITNWKQTFSDISVTRQIEISKHQVGSLQPLPETGWGGVGWEHCSSVTSASLCWRPDRKKALFALSGTQSRDRKDDGRARQFLAT